MSSSAKSNGRRLTLASLAQAKRLPIDFLRELGLHDLAEGGVGIRYWGETAEEIAVKRRTAPKAGDGSFWPEGQLLAAYGLWRLDRAYKAGFVVLVEGESDCWTLWHHGIPALGIPGASSAKVLEAVEHLSCIQKIYVHHEPDKGGETFVAGVQDRLARLGFEGKVFELRMPDGIKDPADLHVTDPERFKARLEEAIKASQLLEIPKSKRATKKPSKDNGEHKEEDKSQTRDLIRLAGALEIFHDADDNAFASFPGTNHIAWPIRSKKVRLWLTKGFLDTFGKAPNSETLQSALMTLESKAIFEGPKRCVFTRLAEQDRVIHVDLCDAENRVVTIEPNGWKIGKDCPVKFRRARGMRPLPVPERGGNPNDLRPFVNVAGDDDFRLLVGWCLAALRGRGPYPVLILAGEQGSAKSTTARVLRFLVDPNKAPLRSEPRDARDLMISASNSWVIAFDNLSHLPDWLSDCLCRLATGGGFGTRELFTDGEEIIFDAMRPCILTSIEDVATRGDLLERSIIDRLPAILDDQRRPEEDFWRDFHSKQAAIFGALLDAISAGLRNLPLVKLPRLPRMADFAVWVSACEPGLGWEPGSFLWAYGGNIKDANELALESSPLVAPIRELLQETETWTGTAGNLLEALSGMVTKEVRESKDWPKRPSTLGNRLRRIAPNLRRTGINIEFDRDKRSRTVILRKVLSSPSSPSPSAGNWAGNGALKPDEVTAGDSGVTEGDSNGLFAKPRNNQVDDGDDSNDGKLKTPAGGGRRAGVSDTSANSDGPYRKDWLA